MELRGMDEHVYVHDVFVDVVEIICCLTDRRLEVSLVAVVTCRRSLL